MSAFAQGTPTGLPGGGRCGRRVRAMDWSETPLGPIEAWSPSLRTSVSIVLEMGFPALLGWGGELTVIHNDSYASLVSGGCDALGRPFREVLPEDGGRLMPALERALAGEASSFENFPFTLQRHGRPEQAYFDLCVSSLRDRGGAVMGVLAVATETTARVRERVHLTEIFERAPAGLSELSPDGRFLYVNDAICQMLGRDRADLLGSSVADVTHPEDLPRTLRAVRGLIESGEPVALDKRYTSPQGRSIFANSALTRIDDEQGRPRSVLAVTVDLTERREAAEAVRRNAERDAFRLALSDALRPLSDPVEVQRAASRTLGAHLRANRAVYVERLGDGDEVLIHDDYSAGVPSLAGRHRLSDYGSGLLEELRAGRTIAVSDVASDPRLTPAQRSALASIGVCAHVAVPIVKGGRLAAFFDVHQATPRVFNPDEIALIEETAERAWDAVQRARAEEELRANDRRKDEFLATLAHELRNPLAPLRNGLELLRLSGDGDARSKRVRAMMSRQVDMLSRLVDDLLEVSRVTRGAIELRLERVDLSRVLRAALETSAPLLERAEQTLLVSLPDEPLWVQADAIRLAQVFGNLLNNAARYSRGRGEVRVVARREGGEAVASVRDTGIGIAPDALPRVFEMFDQGDRSGKGQGGLGIGLTLVRSLVRMHGGSVEAKSPGVGGGAEVIVRLPLAVVATTGEDDARAPAVTAVPATRVLVVDDNHDVADSTGLLLEALGVEVRVAYDGPSALAQVADLRPQVVLLDLGLPGMDGFEIARHLHEHPQGRQAELVALTGWGQEGDRRRTREAGFQHHLVKPLDVRALQALLTSIGGAQGALGEPRHRPG